MPFDTAANRESRYVQIGKMMNTVWIVTATVIVAALVKWLTGSSGRGGRIDPGFVSHQWVREHRQSQMAASRR